MESIILHLWCTCTTKCIRPVALKASELKEGREGGRKGEKEREREVGRERSAFTSLPTLVGVAKLLLQYGANINTHSNEFKESALTLACYKGHLEMVKFLLSAGTFKDRIVCVFSQGYTLDCTFVIKMVY